MEFWGEKSLTVTKCWNPALQKELSGRDVDISGQAVTAGIMVHTLPGKIKTVNATLPACIIALPIASAVPLALGERTHKDAYRG